MDTLMQVNDDGILRLAEAEEQSLASITFAGDLCPQGESAELLASSQVDRLFPEILPILQGADAAIANLESPLTSQDTPIIKSGPHLRADPACARGIRAAGFTAVSLANNHILDMGGPGLQDTLAACCQAGLRTIGAGECLDQASQPLWLELKGLRVALLAFTETEFSIARSDHPGACPADPVDVFYQINQVKGTADLILVMLHGGHEYYELPSPNMVKFCRYLVDLGVHAVICNHVHVPGGFEVYKGAPIIYSTGNFLFPSKMEIKEWYEGYLVRLFCRAGGVVRVELIPYRQSSQETGVRLMNPLEKREFLARLNELSIQLSDSSRLAEQWDRFVRSKRFHYFNLLLGLYRIERRLLRMGIWPFWRLKHSAKPALLNLFTCDSHREIVTSLLSLEVLSQGSGPQQKG